jgi:hypothetical protein
MIFPFPVSVVADASRGTITAITSAVGIDQSTSSDRYRATSAVSGRPHAPRAWAVLAERDTSSSGYLAGFTNGGLSNGWCIRTNGAILTANIGNGGLRDTPNHDISSWTGDNTIHGIVCTYSGHTGSGDLKLYVDRVLVQSASFTGYTDPTTEDFTIGSHPQAGFNWLGKIYGFVVCDAVPNLTDIQQWFDDCKAAADVVNFITGSSQVWSVRRGASNLPATWDEENGTGPTVTKVGSGQTIFENPLTWGW